MGLVYIPAYIYHKNQPNVGKYTIHGWYGWLKRTLAYSWGWRLELYKSYISYKPETQIIDEGPDEGPLVQEGGYQFCDFDILKHVPIKLI